MSRLPLIATLFITACAVEPESLDDVTQHVAAADDDSTFDELMATYCPGMSQTSIPNYRGISGTYVRYGMTEPTEPLNITFRAERDDSDAVGTFSGLYTTESGLPASYAGRFSALPDNPAIGPALGLDVGGDGNFDHTYFVIGLRRSFGAVRSICLWGAQHPFMLTRATWF